jgi:ABC-2 type transport system permease protein
MRVDPIYYLVDATRAGLTGSHEVSIGISLAVAAAAAAVAFGVSVSLLRRGWRLKP